MITHDPQTSCKKSKQRIPPLPHLDPHQDQTSLAKYETSTPKTNSNQLNTISGENMERPYLTQILLQQDMDRLKHDMDSTMKIHMTCPKEDQFRIHHNIIEWTARLTKIVISHDGKYV